VVWKLSDQDGTRRDDHQGWIRSQTLLLSDLLLPGFKINGSVALEPDGVGADQNGIRQCPLQGE